MPGDRVNVSVISLSDNGLVCDPLPQLSAPLLSTRCALSRSSMVCCGGETTTADTASDACYIYNFRAASPLWRSTSATLHAPTHDGGALALNTNAIWFTGKIIF